MLKLLPYIHPGVIKDTKLQANAAMIPIPHTTLITPITGPLSYAQQSAQCVQRKMTLVIANSTTNILYTCEIPSFPFIHYLFWEY